MSATTFRRKTELTSEVTLVRVIRSEWTKLWTLRSTRWSLLVACLFMAGLGPLIAAVTMARWSHLSFGDRITLDPIDRSLGGWHIAQLAIGVLAVMIITGEYATGMIRSSLMAVPRRTPVLYAKMIVFSAVSFLLMLVMALIGYLASMAIFSQHHVNVSLSTSPAFRVLIGTVLFMTVTGIFCTALGTIIRSTAGAISAFVAILFVLPPITELLPSSMANAVHPYLPSNAGMAVAQATPDPHTFSPWGGFALFCGYTLVLVLVAARMLYQRDA